jgi:hypothetical protein
MPPVPTPTMVETTTTSQKIGFSDFADKLEEVKRTTTEAAIQLPIDNEVKTTILLSVEENIKTLLKNLADKREIGWGTDTDPDEFSHLPNSITGVVIYYVIKGIKEEFGYEFENPPKSLKMRGVSKDAKKIAGKKRLLTRDQKNELIEKTQMSFYDKKIASGEMTIESAMYAIRDAYERKQNFEEMGYMLPPKKTEYPYWIDEVVEN